MNKNIIITGTSRGIGFDLAQLFANAGHQVLALSRTTKAIQELASKNIKFMMFDLCDPNDYSKVEEFVQVVWKNKVDVLINNAGVLLNKSFAETTMYDFEMVYKTNVYGVAELTRVVLPFMKNNSHVVTISSMGGVQGSVKFPGLAAYSSSKGAVITLTELLAEEYKTSGISFNVLALGSVQTEMLEEAFPGYEAPISSLEMAHYIVDFALTGNKFYNGKLLQVSSSTP